MEETVRVVSVSRLFGGLEGLEILLSGPVRRARDLHYLLVRHRNILKIR